MDVDIHSTVSFANGIQLEGAKEVHDWTCSEDRCSEYAYQRLRDNEWIRNINLLSTSQVEDNFGRFKLYHLRYEKKNIHFVLTIADDSESLLKFLQQFDGIYGIVVHNDGRFWLELMGD